jgi:hypothetical protein
MSLALRHVPPFLVVYPSILNLDVPSHHAPCPPSVSPPRNIYHVDQYLSITNQLLILIGHLYIYLSGLCLCVNLVRSICQKYTCFNYAPRGQFRMWWPTEDIKFPPQTFSGEEFSGKGSRMSIKTCFYGRTATPAQIFLPKKVRGGLERPLWPTKGGGEKGRGAYNSTILIDSGQPKGLSSTMTLLQLEHKIINFK